MAIGHWRPWAQLCRVVAEPNRDHEALGRPFEDADFHPYECDQAGQNSGGGGGFPIAGNAGRIGDALAKRKANR